MEAHSIRKREKLQRVANRKPHLQLVWSVTPLNVFTCKGMNSHPAGVPNKAVQRRAELCSAGLHLTTSHRGLEPAASRSRDRDTAVGGVCTVDAPSMDARPPSAPGSSVFARGRGPAAARGAGGALPPPAGRRPSGPTTLGTEPARRALRRLIARPISASLARSRGNSTAPRSYLTRLGFDSYFHSNAYICRNAPLSPMERVPLGTPFLWFLCTSRLAPMAHMNLVE